MLSELNIIKNTELPQSKDDNLGNQSSHGLLPNARVATLGGEPLPISVDPTVRVATVSELPGMTVLNLPRIVRPDCENMQPYSEQLEEKLKAEALKHGIQKFVVGGAILDENRRSVLMLKRHPSDFMPDIDELPSGGVNDNETLREGLIREIKEETGLEVNDVVYYLTHFDYHSRTGKLTRQFNFLVTTTNSTEIILNPAEHTDHSWYALDRKDLDLNMQRIFNLLDSIP